MLADQVTGERRLSSVAFPAQLARVVVDAQVTTNVLHAVTTFTEFLVACGADKYLVCGFCNWKAYLCYNWSDNVLGC